MKNLKVRKTLLTYFGFTLFCGLFSLIYEHFSHGVYSNYMVCLFLFPLIGGVLPFSVIGIIKSLRVPGRVSLNLYNSGIATLAIGSCFKGVLEIYGTTSDYIPVYLFVGAALTILGAIVYVLTAITKDPA